ncbi:MAG TPA: translation elongation factor Ts [Lactovum miscens]|uniref:translation elongation factor Ts n=1 Tax=Lactovum miscens TaxID=190387 RepID=UPI002ED8D09C
MMEITAKMVKELRETTGAGVMDAKKALVEVDGDMEKAAEFLREKGEAKAAKKADRITAEGLTGISIEGNVAALIEVNSETDFVARNDQFINLVNETAEVIAKSKPVDNEAAMKLTLTSGDTIESAFVAATATIGEKISFRRFSLLEKTDEQTFGIYQHNGGRIGVVVVLEGGDAELPKAIAMHIAAMNPQVMSYDELDEDFIHSEVAEMKHKIELDNESRAMVGKEPLPFPDFGSRLEFDDAHLEKVAAKLKAELIAEGKPEKVIENNILPGKIARYITDNTKVDQEYTLLSQLYVMDDSNTVEKFLESKGSKVISFSRFEVGEGIEKKVDDFAAEVAAQAGL